MFLHWQEGSLPLATRLQSLVSFRKPSCLISAWSVERALPWGYKTSVLVLALLLTSGVGSGLQYHQLENEIELHVQLWKRMVSTRVRNIWFSLLDPIYSLPVKSYFMK